MTMRLDVVTNDAGELVRREHARELGAGVVIALYRLMKLVQVHDLSNQAFQRHRDATVALVHDYALRAGTNVNILFAGQAVFVSGQILKGTRATYDAAHELASLFEACGMAEISLHRDVTSDDVHAFAEAFSSALRGGKQGSFASPSPRIQLRSVSAATRVRGVDVEKLEPDVRLVRAYASAVVVMRRFFEDLEASRYVFPRRMKRVAQSLVDLSEASAVEYLGVADLRNASQDAGGRAVNGAILAVAMARELTRDRATLQQVAMASLMFDVARPRAMARAMGSGPSLGAVAARLDDEAEDKLAAGAVAVLTALGRLNEPTITRTVVTFEALSLRRAHRVGPVYRGAARPTLQGRIIAVSRRYNELMTSSPGIAPPLPEAVVATLLTELPSAEEQTVIRLLVAALRLVPSGTVLRLANGAVAEVSSPRRLRIVIDAAGGVVDGGPEVDLVESGDHCPVAVLGIQGWLRETRRAAPGALGFAALGPTPTPQEASGVARVASVKPDVQLLPDEQDAERTLMRPGTVASAPPVQVAPASNAPRVPEAAARGTLASTPLLHMLVYLLDRGLSGSVVIFEPDGAEDTIVFDHGTPVKVRTAQAVALLGHELVELGFIQSALAQEAVASAAELGLLLGEWLVGFDHISREQLELALRRQTTKKIATLANLPADAKFAFYQDVDLLRGAGGGDFRPMDALSLVLSCARTWHDRARMHATLARLGPQRLALHPDALVHLLELNEDELRILAAMRDAPRAIEELRWANLADDEVVSAFVYTLVVTRQLDLPGQKGAPIAGLVAEDSGRLSFFGSPPAPAQPPVASSAPSVPPATPPAVVSSVASVPPPDDDGEGELAERALQAMTNLRLAEAAVARGDLALAVTLAESAAQSDPSRPEYAAYRTWVRAVGGFLSVADAVSALGDLLQREPACERAWLYRGRLHKRAGRAADAIDDFAQLLLLNPNHREAQSEDRLLRSQTR